MTDLALPTRSEIKPWRVRPIQDIPAEAFPGSRIIVQGQIEQGEDGVIDFIGVNLHRVIFSTT